MLKNKQKGFTLIELTVVIAIIGIMAVMTVPNYYRSVKKAKYEKAVSEIVGLIKDARNTSIIGKLTMSGADLITPKGGYGVYIQKTGTGGSLISFQDTNENTQYDAATEKIGTYTLIPEIEIKTMSGTQATDYTPPINSDFENAVIIFKPPRGEVVLNENDNTKELIDLFILLERYDENKSKRLKINKISGFIETK